MRRSLRAVLEREDDVEVISEARDLQSALCQVHGYVPQVLVMDLGLTHGCGAETIVELRERAPRTQLVIASMHESPAFAQQALNCGALGFVAKDRAEDELPLAVRAAARREEYVSPRLVRTAPFAAAGFSELCASRASRPSASARVARVPRP